MDKPHITADVFARVHRLKYRELTGTCFAIEVAGRQYLVTAKHLVESIFKDGEIELYGPTSPYVSDWIPTPVTLVGHADDADISVLASGYRHATPLSVQLRSGGGISLGQDLYFFGFPYGLSSIGAPSSHPFPLLKKGMFSGLSEGRWYLDGHNNPGFSGGPVFLPRVSETIPSTIVGVVSGYRPGTEELHQWDGVSWDAVEGIVSNSGIMVAYSIQHALDLIKQNPIGFPIGEESE